MRLIGFSTGALAKSDFSRALRMLRDKRVCAIELSALRQEELLPLVENLSKLDLSQFRYKALHAPTLIEPSYESPALELLKSVAARGWPIIVHPNAMITPERWAVLGESLCIENMAKRKPIGQSVQDLTSIFEDLPSACFCFDIGHARQVDPTMSQAADMLLQFRSRLKQVHVSEVNAQSKHDPLTFESTIAYQKLAHLIPIHTPVILESQVQETEIDEEIDKVLEALNPEAKLALAGD